MSSQDAMGEQESARVITELARVAEPWALRAAATLRLADLIAGGCTRLPELARAAGADADALGRLLRFLCARGVFSEVAADLFALTGPAELLRGDHPSSAREWLDLRNAGAAMDRAYAGLLNSVRTGVPAYPQIAGRSFWEDVAADPRLGESFASMMEARSSYIATDVARCYPWSRVSGVVDVGGGTGRLLAAILAAHPHLQGILFDQIAARPDIAEFFRQQGLAARFKAIAGDFFGDLPSGADVYLLNNVVHDWPDRDASAILSRCAAAAGAGGRVVLVEYVVVEGRNDPEVTAMNLRMLVLFGGKERTLEQLATLGDGAGLRLTGTYETASAYRIIEYASAMSAG